MHMYPSIVSCFKKLMENLCFLGTNAKQNYRIIMTDKSIVQRLDDNIDLQSLWLITLSILIEPYIKSVFSL